MAPACHPGQLAAVDSTISTIWSDSAGRQTDHVLQVPIDIEPDVNDPRALQCWADADVAGARLRLLLDSGSDLSCIPPLDSFTTAPERETRSGRGASGESATSHVIGVDRLCVGDLQVDDVSVELQPAGWPHPPLLGMYVFTPHVCAFRFSRGRIDVGVDAPAGGFCWQQGWTPLVEVTVAGRATARAIWDTGAGITLVDETWARAHPEAIVISHVQDHGTDATGNPVPGWQGMLTGFTINGRHFPGDQPCGVIDLTPFNAHLNQPIAMFLGLPQIQRADWLVDFPRRTIDVIRTV